MAGVFYCSGHESGIIRDSYRSLFRTRVGHYSGHESVIMQDTSRSLFGTHVGHYSARSRSLCRTHVGRICFPGPHTSLGVRAYGRIETVPSHVVPIQPCASYSDFSVYIAIAQLSDCLICSIYSGYSEAYPIRPGPPPGPPKPPGRPPGPPMGRPPRELLRRTPPSSITSPLRVWP